MCVYVCMFVVYVCVCVCVCVCVYVCVCMHREILRWTFTEYVFISGTIIFAGK